MITGVEDLVLLVLAYVAGMYVTSLITGSNRSRDDVISINQAYEHVIADLVARMDVIDLRLKRLDGSVRSPEPESKNAGIIDKGIMHVDDLKSSSHNHGNGDHTAFTAAVADAHSTSTGDEEGDGDDGSMLSIDEAQTGSGESMLSILSNSYVQNQVRRGKEVNGSTLERILSIMQEGPKTSREIQQRLGMSREHTARLMKRLYDMGYLARDGSRRPYRYMLRQQPER